MQLEDLIAEAVYSWDDLGEAFGFAPNYLGSAGGMISRPEIGAVVLITHPDGGRSFDYHDYWDGADLIYTGRGQKGDQKLSGPNKYVAENSHALHLFEATGEPRRLKYLGRPNCTEWWWDDGPDRPPTEDTSVPATVPGGRSGIAGLHVRWSRKVFWQWRERRTQKSEGIRCR